MARKGNNPDRTDTEKEAGSKRRYQSPQTPPQAPRSSPRTQGSEQQGREQGREQHGQRSGQDQQDWDAEGRVDGLNSARGADFDLQKASRDELNAIARELHIEDFETMNREELVVEIRERS